MSKVNQNAIGEEVTQNEQSEFDVQAKFRRVVSSPYFGYLVGQVREILEATITDKTQLKALSSIMMDKMYDWWNNIGDKLTSEEAEVALKNHWDNADKPMTTMTGNIADLKIIN